MKVCTPHMFTSDSGWLLVCKCGWQQEAMSEEDALKQLQDHKGLRCKIDEP